MIIHILRDGKDVAVILGADLVNGFTGFGGDLPTALEALADALRAAPSEYDSAERTKLRAEIRELANWHDKIHLVE